uniref:ATP-binding cassette transporter subfamily G-like protein 4 n=1 Tax=Brachionus plicatilis TaxID=10195 RepID=A0A7H9SNA0_BRAPC|nr:ATP-binding cassette transporter subfamily G-like protein 4 [Brachionus plicatilis]
MERKVTPTKINLETDQINETTVVDLKSIYNDNKPITLSWENINVHTPNFKDTIIGKLLCCKKDVPGKQLINDVNGVAKSGSMMAIMGASGAGKTTLLNVLNFRNRGNLKISGEVKINGTPVKSRAALTSISGYVQQDDLFIATLTVKEQLKFQAMLRMEKTASYQEKKQRVEDLMLQLNLKKCESTVIGAPDLNLKGISGGERRRLAFATELITNPNLLFLDEPTSGLDSFMALTIVDCMRDLVKQGKTIICTIHQPSSEVFQKFDKLCLLAEGKLAFIGELDLAEKFFSSQGFDIPIHFNPADYYIQTLAMIPGRKEESEKTINKVCSGFQESLHCSTLTQDLIEANSMAQNPATSIKLKNRMSYKANIFVQFIWLLWRSFLSTIRDKLSFQIAIVQTIVIAVILGLIYLQIEYNQAGVQNINGIIFLFLTNTSFSNMFSVINTFPVEIPIFLREHQNGLYMVLPYYLSKVVVDLPKFILLPFIFITINYWMSNLNNDVGRFFICVGIVILVANAAVAFGSIISAVAPNPTAASALSAPLLVPLMIFSGFFLNNATIPDYFIWLRYLSWFNYANELLLINQWDGVENIACDEAICAFTKGDDVLNYLKMEKSNYGIDFGAMVALLVGFRLISFFILFIRSFKK